MPGGRREAGCEPPGVGSALPGASSTGSVPAAFRREEGKHGAERSLARSGGSCGSGGGGGGSGPGGERRAASGCEAAVGAEAGESCGGRGRAQGEGRTEGPRPRWPLEVAAAPPGARCPGTRAGRGGAGRPRSRGYRVRASLVGGPCVRPRPDLPGQPGLGTRHFACARSHTGTAVRCSSSALAGATPRGRGGMGTAHAPDSPSILLPALLAALPLGSPQGCRGCVCRPSRNCTHAASRVSREKVFAPLLFCPRNLPSSQVFRSHPLALCVSRRGVTVTRGAAGVGSQAPRIAQGLPQAKKL